ncbi:D-arabinitol dehydrogenase [Yersinia intermedia]|nr:D-arabinitol dehydrogenase [Yersinia intermedia]
MNTELNSTPAVWLHIGAGSFHRAHQAWYLHRLRAAGDNRWSIALANIRDDATPLLATLAAQNGEYMLETVTPAGERQYEKITSLRKIIPWDKELNHLVEQGSKPETRVISFTVTEGGYYLDNQFNLQQDNADIQADLNGDCRTIYGAISRILLQRQQLHSGPVTLLNCDNLRHNGERFRHCLLQFLALRDQQSLLSWATDQTRSPNTMVDRITPRPSDDIAPRVLEQTGFADKAPVMGESFIQWVIEDDFIAGRPALENVGVEMVESVLPYEEAKIRILNASHSCIAWAGTLIGQSYIHEATDRAALAYAVLEGVTFGIADGLAVLEQAGTQLTQASLIGGGARSAWWGQLMADTLNLPIVTHSGGEAGGALGAARLGWLATGGDEQRVCAKPQIDQRFIPDINRQDTLFTRLERYRLLYQQQRQLRQTLAR